MEIATNLKHAICGLFEVYTDQNGMQRIITPLEYPNSGDRIVVRVRPEKDGFILDENGEAALYASMAGGDVDIDTVHRWAEDLSKSSYVRFNAEDETIRIFANSERLIAPYIFRVAEAAQQLYALATSRAERQENDFKERVKSVIQATALELELPYHSEFSLPIAGGLVADHYIEGKIPLIVVAATSATRLLEAEIIHMQYQFEHKPGFVLAVAETQAAVGKKQFERANYYTGKTVTFAEHDLQNLIKQQAH